MEITVHNCVRKNNQTVFVKVTEQMETKNEAKIKAMKDVVAEFILGKDGIQVEMRDFPPDTLMNAYRSSSSSSEPRKTSSKSRSFQTCDSSRITDKQIGLIRKTLQEQNCSENDFCQQYQVRSVEELSKQDAQWIIKDLIAKKKR